MHVGDDLTDRSGATRGSGSGRTDRTSVQMLEAEVLPGTVLTRATRRRFLSIRQRPDEQP
jgi:hypothetical protein